MSDEPVDSKPPGAKVTPKDVIEMAAHLMMNMPEPDELGVFNDEELETWEGELKHICSSISDKVHVLTCVADRFATEAAFIKKQGDSLAKLRKTALNKRERVINRARYWLTTVESMTGKPKVKTSAGAIGIRRSSRAVICIADGCVDSLADAFVKTTRTPDKDSLMKLYKDTGEDFLPGGVTVEQSHSEAVMWPGKVK